MVLADYADERGECFPFIRTIAKRSEQSAATVHRRLRELEGAGLIERVEQFCDHGARTSNLFRLLMDGGRAEPGRSEGTPLSQIERPPLSDCEGDPVTGDIPPNAAVTELEEPPFEPPLEQNPLSPPVGGGVMRRRGNLAEDGPGTQLGALISEFKAADPLLIIDRPAAQRQWAGLSSEERARALAGVSRYLDRWREAGKKFKLRAPSSYLKGRIWNDFAVVQPSAAAPRELSATARMVRWAKSEVGADWVFVAEGSQDWRAWQAAFASEGASFAAGRYVLLPQPDGSARRSDVPGRRFPLSRPPAASDPPARDAAE